MGLNEHKKTLMDMHATCELLPSTVNIRNHIFGLRQIYLFDFFGIGNNLGDWHAHSKANQIVFFVCVIAGGGGFGGRGGGFGGGRGRGGYEQQGPPDRKLQALYSADTHHRQQSSLYLLNVVSFYECAEVVEAGAFQHPCEGEAVIKLTNSQVGLSILRKSGETAAASKCQTLHKYIDCP